MGVSDYSINAVTRKTVQSGSAGTGPYSFTFEIIAETDIAVYFNTTLLTLTTDYTVTINANGTGSVTIVTGTNVPSTPDGDDAITIVGARDIERTTDFVTAGDLDADTLNEALDSQVIFLQQVDERVDRSIKAPVTDSTSISMDLPVAATRANKVLGFDGSGNVTTSTESLSDIEGAATSAAAAAASATAASNAQTAAETAQTAAETAQTAAETAQTGAETAETNAAASAAAAAASAAGIFWKEPVVVSTTANITLSGAQTIDGVSVVADDRVLVKDQTAQEENGIYVAAAGAWSRALPLDTWDEHVGAAVIVSEGSTGADKAWICTVDAGGTLDTTAITWAQLSQVYATATDTTEGVIELATQAEVDAGSDTSRAITPATLNGATAVITTAALQDNAVTLAKMAGGTDGNLITFDANGDPAYVATGTSGQILTSNGAGAAPTFQDAGSSAGLVLLATETISGSPASVDFTANIDGTYDTYIFTLSEIVPGTDAQDLFMRLGDSGGFDSGASDYSYHVTLLTASSASYSAAVSAGATGIRLTNGIGSAAGEACSGVVTVSRPTDGSSYVLVNSKITSMDSNATPVLYGCDSWGMRNANITLDRVQFYMASGNVGDGIIRLYGVAK